MDSRIKSVGSRVTSVDRAFGLVGGLRRSLGTVLTVGALTAACGIEVKDADFMATPVFLTPADGGSNETGTDAQNPTDTVDAALPDVVNVDTVDVAIVEAATDSGMPVDMVDASTPVDMPVTPDVTPITDSSVDVPVDMPPADVGFPCTPTSVVVGNDNVIVAAHGNNVPVVINFTGECPTLGSGSVQARISSAGVPFPMFGITMSTLESHRARGLMNLSSPELVGFPLNTFSTRDGIDSALTGNLYPSGFTMPVDFVVDRVVPTMSSLTIPSFDRGAEQYQPAFMGDSNGKVVIDVKVMDDAGLARSLLTHGTRNTCTLSRGTVPGRSNSIGCGVDSFGGSQSCVPLDGAFVCESDRLIFPLVASVRSTPIISDRDYHAVVDTTTSGTPLTFAWTYVDERGNPTQGTRSIVMR